MTDKEVQKLSRMQLIELLYLLSAENDKIREENEQLKARLDKLVGEALAAKEKTAPISEGEPAE